jgi:hypothetical protein
MKMDRDESGCGLRPTMWFDGDERTRDGEDYKEREMAMEMGVVLWLKGGEWISRLCRCKKREGACTEAGASVDQDKLRTRRPRRPRPAPPRGVSG